MFDDGGDTEVAVAVAGIEVAERVMARARSPQGIAEAEAECVRNDVSVPGEDDRGGIVPGLDTLTESPGAVGETLRKLNGCCG